MHCIVITLAHFGILVIIIKANKTHIDPSKVEILTEAFVNATDFVVIVPLIRPPEEIVSISPLTKTSSEIGVCSLCI